MFEPAIDQASEPAETVGHARRTHTRPPYRSFVPYRISAYGTLADRAARWLMPWERSEYPGLLLGLQQAFWWLSPYTIQAYRQGKRRMSPRVAEEFATLIRAEIDRGLALEAELLVIAAEPSRMTKGFREVKDWGDGVVGDKRNRGKKA